MRATILLIAVVLLGLMAGLFYAYAGSVMPGLRRADDRTVVDAMQKINIAIQNPLFLLIFLGALVATGVAAVQHDFEPALIAAFLLYAATLLITFALNIPLNNRLAAGDLADASAVREAFLEPWIRWNTVRTVTSVAAFLAGVWALHQQ
ncbi:putative membrane protein [Actinoplanes lutulentus]|uniref:Putative membrane protein n=1 Tax=Actinoplanes lutulentus TaxID=1287878 RepID=A0A327ZQU4_9ACTN|nr:anthrone oxygenase family protein [Actinoplanes lutulentus]MBB2941029.1 putative membrane protein [Actinoplanes lutulentus]RAK43338.1 putative membrane protein [Actinoplanes lutulentus]